MNSITLENDLLALERKYWQTIKDKDVQAALNLTDDPCLIAGAKGVGNVDRKSFIHIMESATYVLHSFEVKEGAHVRMLTEHVALLAYDIHEDLTVDGKPVSIDASDASVWIRRDGRWLCALHTESLHGDPYGRDKNLSLDSK